MKPVKIIVSGSRASGKTALMQLIRGILRSAHVEHTTSDPQHCEKFGDLGTGKPYEALALLKPRVILMEDRDEAYVDFENKEELAEFKTVYPSAMYVPAKRSFADRDHNIAFASWCIARSRLRTQLFRDADAP